MDIDRGKKSRRKRRCIPSKYHEIWYEIFTRLPVKTFIVCQSVCKPWYSKVGYLKYNTMASLPLCGLILKSSFGASPIDDVQMNYINLTTNKVVTMQTNKCNNRESLIIRNAIGGGNNEYKLVSHIMFDFGGLYSGSHSPVNFPGSNGSDLCFDSNRPRSQSVFFAIHRGLVLIVHDDGNYYLHNPLTRNYTLLPMPPSIKQYDSTCNPLEKTGFIIKVSDNTLSSGWFYYVVRLCRMTKVIEVYQSYRSPFSWRVSKLELDEELIQSCWCWENNAILPKDRILFFLTNINRGVAVKFERRSSIRAYGFGLPPLVEDGFKSARLGGCEGCLYISYYSSNGVWIWKHVDNGKTVTSEAWFPLFEISHFRQLCTPLAMQCLGNVLNVGELVMPIAFHPEALVVFLRVKSSIFAYDFANDSFFKVVEVDEKELGSSMVVLPYSPCLSSVEAKHYEPWNKASPLVGLLENVRI